jgi:hypothetical protein
LCSLRVPRSHSGIFRFQYTKRDGPEQTVPAAENFYDSGRLQVSGRCGKCFFPPAASHASATSPRAAVIHSPQPLVEERGRERLRFGNPHQHPAEDEGGLVGAKGGGQGGHRDPQTGDAEDQGGLRDSA